MIREVLSTDEQGNPTTVVWRLTPEELEQEEAARIAQVERGKRVAASLRPLRGRRGTDE